MTNFKLINARKGASTLLERSKRQALLMQVVASNRKATFEELAEIMRRDPWVAARWPEYSSQTCRKDFTAALTLVKGELKELATVYLVHQLDAIQEVMDRLLEFADDDMLEEKVRIKALDSFGSFLDKQIRLFGNYAGTKIDVTKTELSFTLEEFLKRKKEYERQKLASGDEVVVEGEILE